MPNHHKYMQMNWSKFSISRKKWNVPQHAQNKQRKYVLYFGEDQQGSFDKQTTISGRGKICLFLQTVAQTYTHTCVYVCVTCRMTCARSKRHPTAFTEIPNKDQRITSNILTGATFGSKDRMLQKVSSKQWSSNDNVSLFLSAHKAPMTTIYSVFVSVHVLPLVGCPAEFR